MSIPSIVFAIIIVIVLSVTITLTTAVISSHRSKCYNARCGLNRKERDEQYYAEEQESLRLLPEVYDLACNAIDMHMNDNHEIGQPLSIIGPNDLHIRMSCASGVREISVCRIYDESISTKNIDADTDDGGDSHYHEVFKAIRGELYSYCGGQWQKDFIDYYRQALPAAENRRHYPLKII